MRMYIDGKLICEVKNAKTYFERFLGLMGKKEVKEPLVFLNCSSVHMWFMKIPIDVMYLDGDMKVIGGETLRPWVDFGMMKGCKHIIEMKKGEYNDEWKGKICKLK